MSTQPESTRRQAWMMTRAHFAKAGCSHRVQQGNARAPSHKQCSSTRPSGSISHNRNAEYMLSYSVLPVSTNLRLFLQCGPKAVLSGHEKVAPAMQSANASTVSVLPHFSMVEIELVSFLRSFNLTRVCIFQIGLDNVVPVLPDRA